MVAEIAGIPHLNQSLSAHKSTSRQLKLMDIFYLNRLEFSVELPLNCERGERVYLLDWP